MTSLYMRKRGNALIYNRLLKQAREAAGLSQDDLANLLGTTASTISGWERREHQPSAYFREKLCSVLEKSAIELGLLPPAERTAVPAIYDPLIPLPIVLVGRDEYLTRLRQRLQVSGAAFMVLLGLPGVGKTALATALSYEPKVRKQFRDGILWLGLGPKPNIPALLSHWGKLLGLSTAEMTDLPTKEAWVGALRSAIGERSMLLIIDDAWNLEDVLACSVGGPNCTHLLTTRFSDIATHVAIDGIARVKELNTEDGMDLLHRLAPSVVAHERSKAKALVEAVGGLPLALTLMGNYLRKQGYSGQLRRIQAALSRLSDVEGRLQISEPRTPGDSYRCLPEEKALSLQAIIAATSLYLNEEARQALYALATLPAKPDSFTEDAALAVTASSVEALDMLIDAGLLESSSEGRYCVHQTIADYARLQLQGQEAYEQLIAYALWVIERQQTDPDRLEQEWSTVLAALEAGHVLGKHPEVIRTATAFVPFLLSRGMYALAELHVQRMREAAMELEDRDGIARALLYQEDLKRR
jgi:transcriptional regulator with XRE-family HTH domain